MGGLTFTISSSGQLAGSATDIFTGGSSTLSGTVDLNGKTNLTILTAGFKQTASGTFTNQNGLLTGELTNNDGAAVTLVVNRTGNPFEYAGNYTGTFTSQTGDSGTLALTISGTGAMSGTVDSQQNGELTLTGTVTLTGVVHVTVQGNNTSNPGGAGFSPSGQLILFLFDPSNSNSVTKVTLSKSTD